MRWLFGALCAMLLPGLASAHNLGVEWKLEGDVVRIAAYYDDDTAAAEAVVLVLDEGKAAIARGKTDDRGAWAFSRPPAGKYGIVVDAGGGHRRSVRLTIPAGPDETAASDEPSREEFTRSRWPELTFGLGIIAVGAMGLRWFLHKRRPKQPARGSPGNEE